jgi:DNA-binding response OmpR family regulator
MATVLIVDDDAGLREGLAETLIDLGHRAIAAPDGGIALEAAAQERIDAVLLVTKRLNVRGFLCLE